MQHSPTASVSTKRTLRAASPEATWLYDEPGPKAPRRNENLAGSIQKLAGDPNKYKALIVPIELLPVMERFLNELLTKMEREKDRLIDLENEEAIFSIMVPDEDSKKAFINDFGATRRLFLNALDGADESDLITNVPSDQFDAFKDARKLITKWFVSGSHLFHRLVNEEDTNRYLKINFDYSVAVTDAHLKEKCTNKIMSTKKTLETSLLQSVLLKANSLNFEVKSLWDKLPKSIFLKAFRVVKKAHKHLLHRSIPEQSKPPKKDMKAFRNQNKRHPPHANERNPYRKHDWPKTRPRRDSNFTRYPPQRQYRQHNNYEDEYPPHRNNYYNHRRSRRINSEEEEDRDFSPPPSRHYRRSFYERPARGDYYY